MAYIGYLIGYCVVMLIFGLIFSRYIKNINDFYVGGQRISWWIIGATISASMFGATSLMVSCGYARLVGLSSIWLLGIPTVACALGYTFIFSRKIRRLTEVISIPDFVEKRYDEKTRALFMVIILLALIAFCTSQILALGKVLNWFTDTPLLVGMVIALVVVGIYSTVGGYFGVVATDVVQTILLFIGLIIFTVGSVHWAGDWSKVGEVSEKVPQFTSLFSAAFSPLAGIGWVVALGFPLFTAQDIWQRFISAKDENNAFYGGLFSAAIFVPLYILPIVGGMAGAVWIATKTGVPADPERFMAWTAREMFGGFTGGLIFLGIAAAIMSTLDTALVSGASNVTRDILQRYVKKDAPKEKILTWSRYATIVMAVVAFLIASLFASILSALFLTGNIMVCGLLVPTFCAFYWRRATSTGAFLSGLIGIIFVILDFVLRKAGAPPPWPGEPVSVLIGLGISIVVMVIASLASKHAPSENMDLG